MIRRLSCVLAVFVLGSAVFADGPADNQPDSVRQVPPAGIELSQADRQRLEGLTQQLREKIDGLKSLRVKNLDDLLVDIEIFHRAADQALRFNELFREGDIKQCEAVLAEGLKRAEALSKTGPYWIRQTGLVVRGYRSRIDGTVQPYGLEVPASYQFDGEVAHRCDLWFHGRGETAVEVQFIAQRMRSAGQFPLTNGFVLHPFGRYSNAFKFAGEIDVLEALAHARRKYRIDEDRIAVRGFSMGGAGCWQMAVHYSDMFFAANPGAGFSETPEFLKFFQGETLAPTDYEQKLWNLYDAPGWAINIHQIPTVAYSGEIDRQKQAADVMEAVCKEKGIQLTHIIGPETAHKIHPDSNKIIAKKLESLAKVGREATPESVHFATYSLKYNQMNWITVNALEEHWNRAEIIAHVVESEESPETDNALSVQTQNLTDFTINFPAGTSPFQLEDQVNISLDKQVIENLKSSSDRSFHYRFRKADGKWNVVALRDDDQGLRKRHNLQGPIDDALMDSFVFVKPTGEEMNEIVKQWVDAEFNHAVAQWRQQMRGDARVKNDVDITDEDIALHNLILWGSPGSNLVYKKIAEQLPIQWSNDGISIDQKTYPGDHAPILIYPNPLNPKKYIVINSSFTYREYDYLNNARQTPKLPDWAIIDLKTSPNSRYPGKVVDADFFDEQWRLK